MNREHRIELESKKINDVCEHYHFIPGQDGSYVCVDVIRTFDQQTVIGVDWYSPSGKDRTGNKMFSWGVAV